MLETVARAGSLAGTYAWSVWLLSPLLDIFGLGVAHNWQVGSLMRSFGERLCGLKRLALRNGFAQAAPEEWLTPVLHMIQTEPQFWRYGKFSGVQSWRLFRFVQGFGIHTDPGIGSLREPARAIAPGKKAEPPPIFFVKKDLHPQKKHRRQRETPPTPVCCCKRSTLLSHRYKVWAFQHITIVPSDPPFRLFAETCRTEIVLMFQAAVLGALLAYAVRPIAAGLSAPSPAHPNRYLPNRIAAGIQTPRYRSIRQKIRRLSRSRK